MSDEAALPTVSDIKPGVNGVHTPVLLVPQYAGIDSGQIFKQIISQSYNEFRVGQNVHMEVEMFLDEPAFERVRLKPYWLRPNAEFRPPGFPPAGDQPPRYLPIDTHVFGAPDASLGATDRVWQPGTTPRPILNPGPGVAVPNVLWRMEHDVWEFEIPTGEVAPGWSMRQSFFVVAHGYAIGFQSENDPVANPPAQDPDSTILEPQFRFSWQTGYSGPAMPFSV